MIGVHHSVAVGAGDDPVAYTYQLAVATGVYPAVVIHATLTPLADFGSGNGLVAKVADYFTFTFVRAVASYAVVGMIPILKPLVGIPVDG